MEEFPLDQFAENKQPGTNAGLFYMNTLPTIAVLIAIFITEAPLHGDAGATLRLLHGRKQFDMYLVTFPSA